MVARARRSLSMNRSKINRIIADAIDLFAEHHLALPPFADWTPAEWRARAGHVRGIVERGLGWDVTDFGREDFERVGLVLFTLRNGHPEDCRRKDGVLYAEKVMAVRADQVTPMHFHRPKTEDIINRGAGTWRSAFTPRTTKNDSATGRSPTRRTGSRSRRTGGAS
jgi:D-lyxose ketol-isomerase